MLSDITFLSVGVFRKEIFLGVVFLSATLLVGVVSAGASTGQMPLRNDSCDAEGDLRLSVGESFDSDDFS